ncbi:uncharacterized protein LOC114356642 [Ostrinia furnacalis]|uniref:uncharacterized protein LOC114356642 n=1 Tax=Ostrinia furnacalis TaxID=93504 RepID=UPI00103AFFD0|nr:uncharacterized protein LOC114356642 [Ostrinia furnacalis]
MQNINEGQIVSISMKDLFEVWASVSQTERNERILQFVMSKSVVSRHEYCIVNRLKSKIRHYSLKIEEKWKSAGSDKERFLLRYKDWLETEYFKFDFLGDNEEFSSEDEEPSEGATPSGSHQKAFLECSDDEKRQRVKDHFASHGPSQLSFAAQIYYGHPCKWFPHCGRLH